MLIADIVTLMSVVGEIQPDSELVKVCLHTPSTQEEAGNIADPQESPVTVTELL